MKTPNGPCYVPPPISPESFLYRQERNQCSLPVSPPYRPSTKGFYFRTHDDQCDVFGGLSSSFHWLESGPLTPDVNSVDSSPDTWSSLSSSGYDHNSMPMCDENNYLTWSYDVSDLNPSLYAPSTHQSHPASPSTSTVSASTEDSILSPPASLAEFGNVFDFDFNASLPNDMQASTSSHQWLHVPGQHPYPSRQQAFPSPAVKTEGSETQLSQSREPSPNQSDNDQNNPRRRYPCLILGCTRRFTSQYTLKVHMEAHKPKPRVSFPCTLGCSEKFSRQHDRLRHEVAKHGKVCEFSCEECGRFFSTKKTLGNHKCPVAQGTRWVDA